MALADIDELRVLVEVWLLVGVNEYVADSDLVNETDSEALKLTDLVSEAETVIVGVGLVETVSVVVLVMVGVTVLDGDDV